MLVDGGPVSACTYLAVEAGGRDVLTIEGFAQTPEFAQFEEAFVRHAALQCGYCTPGLLLTLKSLRDAGELSSEEEIRHGLDGNLCRCTGYRSILEAAREVASLTRHRAPGVARGRRLAAAQGRAREAVAARPSSSATWRWPGCCTARSCAARTRTRWIRSIDSAAALELDGVVAVLTGADLDDIEPYYGHAIKDRPIVALDRVRFAGEPVAAVAAIDEATAEAAVRAIEVEYEQLPVLDTLEQALAPDAPRLHQRRPKVGLFHGLGELGERQGNVCYRHVIAAGDVEEARARRRDQRSRGATRSRPSTSTRWRPTRRSPTTTATASRCGPTASTRSWSRPRSPTCSGWRSARSGSSCPTSAAASARSPTRRWSR